MRRLFLLAAALLVLAAPATAQLWNAARSSFAIKIAESVFDNGGAPWPFFSTINAINYNQGGAEIAYHVPNIGAPNCNAVASGASGYRSDFVNFATSTDGPQFQLGCNSSGGVYGTGNWYEYTVNISQAGPYVINLRVADGQSGGSWAFAIDGTTIGSAGVPNTGNWQTFTTIQSPQFNATLGNHVIRLTGTNSTSGNSAGDISSFQGSKFSNPTTPAPAAAAGFNQQIANYDFVNNTANGAPLDWTQKNLWLADAGAAHPLFWKGWSGFPASFTNYPDSYVQAGTDPQFGNRALVLHWDQSSFVSGGPEGTFLQTAGTANIEPKDPQLSATFYYIEFVFRVDTLANNEFFNLWGLAGAQPPNCMEHDGLETSGLGGGSTLFNHCTGWVPANNLNGSLDWTQYHTMAWRVVSTGNYQPDSTGNDESNNWMCSYVGGDGQAITSSQNQGCVTNVSQPAQITSGEGSRMNFQFFLKNNNVNNPGAYTMYVKSMKLWTCNAWSPTNQLAACYSTIPNPSP